MRFCFKFVILSFLCFLPAMTSAAAEMPKTGAAAPVFALKDQADQYISLKTFRGKWVVLFFYPQDVSPGCPLEAHNFQRDIMLYTEKNAEVVGVSVDSPAAHRQFCIDEELTLTLLSDEDAKVIDLYGSLAKDGRLRLANRNTFIIDPRGVVRKIYLNVRPAKHSAEVLADLEKLQAAGQ